jgi:hypothetical protein
MTADVAAAPPDFDLRDVIDGAALLAPYRERGDAARAARPGCRERAALLPPSLFDHPAAELSVDDSAQLGEDGRQPWL